MVGEMSFQGTSANALDELPCRYGESKLLMRGPRREPRGPYFAVLGGTETYGKFVANPFPTLLEQDLDKMVVNLGSVNAGLDSFVYDRDVLDVAAGAECCLIQVLGAQNLTNRFYRVHPRRNDRFLEPSALLRSIYPEVDFTEFNFTNHMLRSLEARAPDRFLPIVDELKSAWSKRMKLLFKAVGRKPLLIWVRHKMSRPYDKFGDPALVDRAMLEELEPQTRGIVEIMVPRAAQGGEMDGMMYGNLQAPLAEHMIGPVGHRSIAERLLPLLGAE
ncbi:MAG: DUF6473 family protein [Sedimentitalea sp.]